MKKHRQLFATSLLLGFLLGCSTGDSSKQAHVEDLGIVYSASLDKGEAKIDLGIAGMSCEVMCVNLIESTLNEMEGVKIAEVAFEKGENVNHAIIEYKEGFVSEEKLINAVEQLAKGQYKVKTKQSFRSENAAQQSSDEEEQVKGDGKKELPEMDESAYSGSYNFPNLFNVFRSILN